MKINIANIKKQNGLCEDYTFIVKPYELNILPQEANIKGDITVCAQVANVGDVIYLTGNIQAIFIRCCGRCTIEYDYSCKGEFSEKFYPAAMTAKTEDDFFYQDDLIDISQIVRESLLLAEPLGSLCRSDCLGLCSVCGADKNVCPCSCDETIIDPRLMALQQFFKK